MKGEFRNGTFVDDEQSQEFRHIEYDLDPEKMEKIWVGLILSRFLKFEVLLFPRKDIKLGGKG